MNSVAVIGAGISGLSCAYELAKRDVAITIFAEQFTPYITSNKAAAFWFPYHIRNDNRGIEWCRRSYDFYKLLSANTDTGISMHRLVKMIDKKVVDPDISWLDFMPEKLYRVMDKQELTDPYIAGFEVTVPLIETQVFLPWMMQTLREQDVKFVQQKITSFDMLAQYDCIINCSGLGARELCNDDEVYPARGQVALLSPQPDLPIFIDNEPPLYMVPRKDAIIIGGTMEEHVWEMQTVDETLQDIQQKIAVVFPCIKDVPIVGSWAGLRPCRNTIRLEREGNIIHNYGHGGSGFTLAWGCANDVIELLFE
jgi:D-amino-acid oxidase